MDPHFAEQNLGAGLGKIWAEFSAIRAERDALLAVAQAVNAVMNDGGPVDAKIEDAMSALPDAVLDILSTTATEGGDRG